MESPVLVATSAKAETFGGVTYHLDGELVPVLTVDLSGSSSVYFEHHILLWKNPSVAISIKAMKGAAKRMMAGIQIFVTEAKGQGPIAFSRDGAGHIVPIHLARGPGTARARAPVPRGKRHHRLQLRAGQGRCEHPVRRHGVFHRQVQGAGNRRRAVAARVRQRVREDTRGRRSRSTSSPEAGCTRTPA